MKKGKMRKKELWECFEVVGPARSLSGRLPGKGQSEEKACEKKGNLTLE